MLPRSLFRPLVLLLPWLVGGNCQNTTGPLLPLLVGNQPAVGQTVARSAWLILDFASPVGANPGSRIELSCGGQPVAANAHRLDSDTLVVQPLAMPAGASCQADLATTGGVEIVSFQTAAAGTPFEAIFDRTAPDRPLPFPDDVYLVPEPANATGWAIEVVLPDATGRPALLLGALAGVVEETSDGWSPLGPIIAQLSAAADPDSLPLDRRSSLDPLSSVALIDITPGSPTSGQRVPFQLIPRSDTLPSNPTVHVLVLQPGFALEPEGVYGLVVTDRVLDGAGEPLARSSFFDAVLSPPVFGEAPEISAERALAAEVLIEAALMQPVPIPADDVVLATRMTIRSTDHFVEDPLALRAQTAATPPNVQIDSVLADPDPDVAAIVTGTFDVPLWLVPPTVFFERDEDGLPVALGTQSVPFTLALPADAATTGNAPLLMYQHGSPGSAQNEVPGAARSFLGEAGFAVAGFTDTINRQFPTVEDQTLNILAAVLFFGAAPDYYVQTYGEQMGFVRALQSLSTLDVLPIGAPDGVPDVDPTELVYEGISYGSNHAQAFLAYEPAIRGAALVAGAVRFVELLEHQDRTTPLGGDPLLEVQLPGFLPGVRAPDLWMGLQLFAVTYDPQDPHNHARFLYREPVVVDGTTQKASLLVVEGIDDSFTSNNSTRSLARQLGIPQLDPAPAPQPDLAQVAGPIQGNVDPTTTAAMVQYVPDGSSIPFTPGCQFQFEGHFCAQTNPTARLQRVDFYQSALGAVPTIE